MASLLLIALLLFMTIEKTLDASKQVKRQCIARPGGRTGRTSLRSFFDRYGKALISARVIGSLGNAAIEPHSR